MIDRRFEWKRLFRAVEYPRVADDEGSALNRTRHPVMVTPMSTEAHLLMIDSYH